MTLAPAPLQSRFGRRLLLLFVGCAVLPIALVAAVSYGHITRELRSQSEARLHQANKAMGLALYERLLLLDATLKSIPPRVLRQLQAVSDQPDASRMLNTGLDLLASRRFVALEFAGDDGTHIPVFGTLEQPPALTAADRDDLGAGLPLILSRPRAGGPARTFLLRRVDRAGEVRGTLIGEVSPEFLWGTLASNLPSPSTVIAVVAEPGDTLFRSTQADLVSQADPITEAAPDRQRARVGGLADAGRSCRPPGRCSSTKSSPHRPGRWC